MLAHRARGSGSPVVLIHGFTQSGAMWSPVVDRLADHYRMTTVDAPGHGGSSEIAADLVDGAELIAEAGGGPATYVGYSMGGRFALHVALARPDLVSRLVLVSATAGIDGAAERAERRRTDEVLAARVEREGVEEFVRWWLHLPLFATLPPDEASASSRLGNSASGLASSLRLAGTGTQVPLWDRLAELAMPVLVVAGGLDDAYVARAERMAAGIADATVVVVEGAGHSVPLERPDILADAIRRWVG